MIPTTIELDQWYTEKVSKGWFLPNLPCSTITPESFESATDAWYVQNTMRTWNMDYTYAVSFSNASLGLIGELHEASELISAFRTIDRVELIKELGDCLYYLTVYKYLLGLPTVELESSINSIGDTWFPKPKIQSVYGFLAEYGKKAAFHKSFKMGSPINTLVVIETFIRDSLPLVEVDLESLKKINIAKLQARHGEGFNGNYVS